MRTLNIYTQCCGIILLLVILWFYGNQKRLHLNTGEAFLRTLLVALGSIILDALSIVVICNMEHLPALFVRFVCKTYLASLVCLALCAVHYICTDIYTKKVKYRKAFYYNLVVAIIAITVIYVSPIYIHCEREGAEVYTYGTSVLTAYAAALIYLIINMSLLVRKKAVIRPSRRAAMMFWMMNGEAEI